MPVDASSPIAPVKPVSHRHGPRRQEGADNAAQAASFAKLLKGHTDAAAADDARADSGQSAKPKADGAQGDTEGDINPDAQAGNNAAKPAAAKPDDATAQPAWWRSLQLPPVDAEAGTSTAEGEGDALDALKDNAAHGKGGRHGVRADAALESARGQTDTEEASLQRDKPVFRLPDAGEAAGDAAAAEASRARIDEQPVSLPASDGNLPSLGAVVDPSARAQHDSTPAVETPKPTAEASLPMPPEHPAFPQALGVQLSTWLQDGVEHARLELHPRELGPIEVRIAVADGQTRIDLGADVASTRAALSEAFSQLAEALGEVGLSLSGGSVSDQSRQNAQGQGQSSAQARAAADNRDARDGLGGRGGFSGLPAVPAAAVRRQGLLDLYA